MKTWFVLIIIAGCLLVSCRQTKNNPHNPKGLQFAEDFANLPYLKTGTQTYQNSSTDPAEDQFNDHTHWLYTDKDSSAVLADISGPGCIYRIWSTGNDGDSNYLKIYIDGETNPRIYDSFNHFHDASPLSQKPQVGTGGDKYLAWWSYRPIPFSKSCKVVRQGNFRPFYSITFHTYSDSAGVKPFCGKEDLGKMEQMWNNPAEDPKSANGNQATVISVKLAAGQAQTIFGKEGAGSIASIKIANYLPEKGLRLKMFWDGSTTPAVDAPVKWFFGSVDNGGDLKALGVGTVNNNGYCYFPMPFWKNAKIVLENNSAIATDSMKIEIQYNPTIYEQNASGYFYAFANEEETPRDHYTCLKTSGAGQVIGMAKRMPKGGHACEGDEIFYIDGSSYPDIYGTGEEDYNNNAWWTNSYNSFPTHGCIGNDCYYRIHYPDMLVFSEGIDMKFETWQPFYIASLVWYYKTEKPSLTLTDSLDIANEHSEQAHQYKIDGLKWTGEKTGRYPGIAVKKDSLSDDGKSFSSYCSFNVKIDNKNKGVRLRLRTDNGDMQVAKVWIDEELVNERLWKISKNRFDCAWVDSEFEIPQKYAAGKDHLNIRIEPDPESRRLWNEYRYWVYSYNR